MFRKAITAILARSAILAVLAISALAQAQSSWGQQAGLANPGFEEPRVEEGTFVLLDVLVGTMPGWKTTDTHFEIWGSGFLGVPAHEGTQFVELNAYIDGALFQDSKGIPQGSVLEFTFAHRGRSGDDTMMLSIGDLGADNALGGGDDTILFAKQYTTGKDAWAVYDSTTEPEIKALGNTVMFAYSAISTATGELGEGNLLDAANFGVGVVSEAPPENAMKLDVTGGAFAFGYRTTAEPGFTEFPNTDSPHPGITRRNRADGEYFSYAQNTLETEVIAQESSLVHYPAKSEGSGVLCPGQNPGDVAIARFTAMNDGEYHFKITAQLIEEDPTGAGVTIYVGSQAVAETQLHKHLVPWTTSSVVKLTKGQTFDIVVDSGEDKNWEKDHVLVTAKAWTTGPSVSNETEAATRTRKLINSSFEEPRGKESGFAMAPAMPGWKTTDAVFEIWSTGFEGFEAHDGTQFVELNAKLDGTLYQDLTRIGRGASLDFSFAHRGRNGNDTMKLTVTDLGIDNTVGTDDDRVLFVKEYTTGKDAWEVYNSTSEDPIVTLGNTIRFAYTAVHGTGGRGPDKTEGNFLDSVEFGVDVGRPATPSFALEEAKQMLIGAWKADLSKTETRYGALDVMVRPMVIEGFLLKFSADNEFQLVTSNTVMSGPYKLGGPDDHNYFQVVTLQDGQELTEDVRIIDKHHIILKSRSGATPLVFVRHFEPEDSIVRVRKTPVEMVTAGDSETTTGDAAEHILTRDLESQKGAIWSGQKIDFNKNFRISAEIYLGTKDNGADGLALVFQAKGNHVVSDGGGLGYQGISPSIVIEFDTYHNGDETPRQAVNVNNRDPIEDHVGLRTDGDPVHTASDYVVVDNLEDGRYHMITFEWNAGQQTFNLSLDGKQTFKDKSIPKNGLAGQQVYFGFTAATGGLSNEHKVRSISFSK